MKADLNYLSYFYHVVRENGFTRAAEKLCVQQPVVSRAIKLLENQLGQKLLERQRKQVILTNEGKRVFSYAEKIFSILNELEESFVSDLNEQKITVASSDSLGRELGFQLERLKKEQHSSLRIELLEGASDLFLEQIENGEIDLGFFFNVPEVSPNLSKQKWIEVEFVFVAKRENGKTSSILSRYISSQPQSKKRPDQLPLFKKYKQLVPDADIAMISNNTHTRLEMALKGLGATIVPLFLCQKAINQNKLIQIGESFKLPLYVVERKSAYRTKLKKQVLESLKNIVSHT